MKIFKFLVVISFSILLVGTANAASGNITAKIVEIRIHSFDPAITKEHTVMLEGLISLGTCLTAGSSIAGTQHVALYIDKNQEGKEQLAALIAAKLNNTEVRITIPNTTPASNQCRILQVIVL